MNILQALTGLIPSIGESIKKFVKDKDLAAQLENDIQSKLINFQSDVVQAKASVIIAEASGKSWIQRSWRPITMLSFVGIIVNNYILVPYGIAFGLEVPMLEIPPGMWGLLTVGVGGYIGGRTYEKVKGVDS